MINYEINNILAVVWNAPQAIANKESVIIIRMTWKNINIYGKQ